jgi:hypothetical protein
MKTARTVAIHRKRAGKRGWRIVIAAFSKVNMRSPTGKKDQSCETPQAKRKETVNTMEMKAKATLPRGVTASSLPKMVVGSPIATCHPINSSSGKYRQKRESVVQIARSAAILSQRLKI